jgi:tetratricopeptide (TPR) repeat protein
MRLVETFASLGLAALVITLAPGLAGSIQAERPATDGHQRLYYPDGPMLRHASLGFAAPVADYVWLQAIQYYGGYRRGEHDLRYFAGLVEATTTLDPRFSEAYHFASLVLAMEFGDHQGAIDLLKRGILANPDDWRLHFNVGFIHYVFLHEYTAAALWFEAAAALPGATDFSRRFAAFSRRRAGDLEGSLILWEHLGRTTESADMRELADRMVEQCREALRGAPLQNVIGPPAPASSQPATERGGSQ